MNRFSTGAGANSELRPMLEDEENPWESTDFDTMK